MTIEVPLSKAPSKIAEKAAMDLTLLVTNFTKDPLESVDILLLSAVGYSVAGSVYDSQSTGESRLDYIRERLEYLHEFLIGRMESDPKALELAELIRGSR